MSGISELLAKILTARYGRDVRQSIHDAIDHCYNDAITNSPSNSIMEVSQARGGYETLGQREDAQDNAVSKEALDRQEADNKEATDRQNADNLLSSRIDNLSSLPSGSTTGDAELIDCRVGIDGVIYPTAGDAIRANDKQLKEILDDVRKGYKILEEKPTITDSYKQANYHQSSGVRTFAYNESEGVIDVKHLSQVVGSSVVLSSDISQTLSNFDDRLLDLEDDTLFVVSYDLDIQDDFDPYFIFTAYDGNNINRNKVFNIKMSGLNKDGDYIDIKQELVNIGSNSSYYNKVIFNGISSNAVITTRTNSVMAKFHGSISKAQIAKGMNLKEKMEIANDEIQRLASELQMLLSDGDGTKFLSDDGTYKTIDTTNDVKTVINNTSVLAIRNMIPNYFFDIASDTTYSNEYLNDIISRVPEGKHFYYVTDLHQPRHVGKTAAIISYLRSKIGGKYVLNGGDNIDKDRNKYLAVGTHIKAIGTFLDEFGSDFISTIGNHDNNTAGWIDGTDTEENTIIPFKVLKDVLLKKLDGIAVCNDESVRLSELASGDDYEELLAYFATSYYIDDSEEKTRFIVLNTGNPYGKQYDYFGCQGTREIFLACDWIYHTLLSTPSGYDVIMLGHQFDAMDNNQLVYVMELISGMLSALKTKRIYRFHIGGTVENQNFKNWFDITVPHMFDFSSANDVGCSVILSANSHYDIIHIVNCKKTDESLSYWNTTESRVFDLESEVNQSDGEIPVVVTQTDSIAWADTAYGLEMNVGTITENCFDIVTLNSSGITLTRVGVGEDRVIPFT